jgi:hypothetical protein
MDFLFFLLIRIVFTSVKMSFIHSGSSVSLIRIEEKKEKKKKKEEKRFGLHFFFYSACM